MKRVLALLLLTAATTMQANDVAQTWREFGKKHRAVSALKALLTGVLAFEAGRVAIDHGYHAFDLARDKNQEWSKKWEKFAKHLVGLGGMTYTSFGLAWYFTIPDAKHALSIS